MEFYTINCAILLNHLCEMGLGGNVLQCLWSFLEKQTQKIYIDLPLKTVWKLKLVQKAAARLLTGVAYSSGPQPF